MKKKCFVVILILLIAIVLTTLCAFFINPHNIKVREETIVSNKIDKNINELLVLYFTDLHYGNNLGDEDIDYIEKKINDFKPNVIIFGGDLINANCNNTSRLESFLTNIKAKYGKYAVLGDEDVYNEDTKRILNNSDFRVLSNNNERIYINGSFINIVGIEPSVNGSPDVAKAYEGVNDEYYTFVITHCPDLAAKLENNRSDYILSGHSLGGPIYLPLINFFYREKGCLNYFKGKNIVNDIILDISNGLGTKGKDVRLFSSPEIVFYKLKIKSQ